MLFTGKGDDGTTKTFGCNQRISKSSAIAEALGSVDEINSLLGVVKMQGGKTAATGEMDYHALLSDVQQDLFIVQAELAGAEKKMDSARVEKLSGWVNAIEKELPPITSFFISGGTELGALCDYARTVARRAERRVVDALRNDRGDSVGSVRGESLALKGLSSNNAEHSNNEENHQHLLAYMNRLSSLLYALARLANHRAGVKEEKPHY
ncbi:MAG: ATP:cob(I)alamin adenosyltransferase [bacterium]|nr:ATP:cob(I)alamin adenosyltransferase [bacterium]